MASLLNFDRSCQVPDVIPYYIPGGGISLLVGAPNVGKSALLASIFKQLRDNRPVFGHQPRQLPGIGVVNADRGWEMGVGMWFERAGYPEISFYSMTDDSTFNPKKLRHKWERTDLLANFIDRLKLPKQSAVLVDPVSLFLGGNLLDYDACMVACQEIRAYLKSREYTLVAAAHSAKLKADKKDRYARMQDQVLGSTAILGFTDTQMYLASPEEIGKSYYAFQWNPHGAKSEIHFLERDEQGLFVPYDGGNTLQQQNVLKLFPGDGSQLSFSDLLEKAQEIPLSRATLHRLVDTLIGLGLVERVGHGTYRKLYDTH